MYIYIYMCVHSDPYKSMERHNAATAFPLKQTKSEGKCGSGLAVSWVANEMFSTMVFLSAA